jgi:hypothetical protein
VGRNDIDVKKMEEVIIIIGLDNNVWQNTVTNSSLSLLLAHILQQLGVCLPLKSIHTRKTIRIVFFFGVGVLVGDGPSLAL